MFLFQFLFPVLFPLRSCFCSCSYSHFISSSLYQSKLSLYIPDPIPISVTILAFPFHLPFLFSFPFLLVLVPQLHSRSCSKSNNSRSSFLCHIPLEFRSQIVPSSTSFCLLIVASFFLPFSHCSPLPGFPFSKQSNYSIQYKHFLRIFQFDF